IVSTCQRHCSGSAVVCNTDIARVCCKSCTSISYCAAVELNSLVDTAATKCGEYATCNQRFIAGAYCHSTIQSCEITAADCKSATSCTCVYHADTVTLSKDPG